MKSEYQHYLGIICLFAVLCLFGLTSCAISPVKMIPEKDNTVDEPIKAAEEKEEALSKPSFIQVLSAEAEKFFLQGNFNDALSIYDQLLSKVKEDKKL